MPADRRGSGSDDDSQYGWLYGADSPRARGGTADPEPTRMIPRLDRETGRPAAAGSGAAPPPPRIVQPPREGRGPRGPRRRPRVRRVLVAVVAAWLAFLVATPLWAVSTIDKVDIEPRGGERPPEQPGTTYLLVGSDSRRGLSAEENRRLGTGGVGDVGQRTDTIMLLHTGAGPDLLLSIPRDSIVDIPGRGTGKINAAFAYGGPRLLVRTIEQATGVRVDDYVEIGFGGFVNAVDAVGGITVCPRERMVDPKANLRIRKGCQEVDGVKALGYSRSRYVSRFGDLDRARRQREVISAIGSEVASPWTFLNPVRYWRVNDAARTSLRVSEGTGPVALAQFGWAMTRVDGTDGLTCGMPIRDQQVNWDEQRAEELLGFVREDDTGDIPQDLCTPTGLEGVE